MGSRSPSPEMPEQGPILGTLYLVGKQGHRKNADLQSFPIDTDLITIGRDVDCDVRLYFPDVSKVHCEIRFDLLSSTANLLILGSNPVSITPAHDSSLSVKMSKGEAHQLQTNDTFTIRKKTFRFEYAADNRAALQPVIENTPMKRGPAIPQEKRRGSYRLSLVPEGKRFVPLPSNLGLPETPRKPVPAQLASASSDDEAEEEEAGVEVVEGDNNDKIYLEPQTPMRVASKPTVRPQTEAAPRTRKVDMLHTPVRGPSSLRKALLMRSARKVLAATPARAVEVAPEVEPWSEDDVESEKPMDEDAPADEHDEFEDEMYDDEEEQDEAEADMSLDEVPVEAGDVFVQQDASLQNEYAEDEEFYGEREEHELEHMDEERSVEDDSEEHEEFEEQQSQEDEEEHDHDHEGEDEAEWQDEVDPASIPLPETPLPARYTPQAIRQPRKSLAEIGGPPVRFERLPSTPGAHPLVERVPATPGTMGKASRRLVPSTPQPAQQADEWQDEEDDAADYEAERQRRRESLATPRALPLPPTSFRAPVHEAPTPPSIFFASPAQHPALTRQAPAPSNSPPATPMDALKQRMAALRLQSSRRATVGFAMPTTPAAKPRVESALYTGGRMRKVGPSTPFAPLVAIESLPATPTPETVALQDISPQKIDEDLLDSDDEPLEAREGAVEPGHDQSLDDEQLAAEYLVSDPSDGLSSPPTPSYSGLRDMLREPAQPPATPYFTGLRRMFASTPEQPSTPQLSGLRELMKTPAPEPATPVFAGIRAMFATRPETPATPAMDLDEVFEELGAKTVGLEAELEALSVEPEEMAEAVASEPEIETPKETTPAPTPAPAPVQTFARTTRARKLIPPTSPGETKSEPIRARPRAAAISRVPRAAAARTRVAAPLKEVEPQARVTRSIVKPAVKAKDAEEKAPAPSRIPKKLPARAVKPVPAAVEEPVRTTRARARA